MKTRKLRRFYIGDANNNVTKLIVELTGGETGIQNPLGTLRMHMDGGWKIYSEYEYIYDDNYPANVGDNPVESQFLRFVISKNEFTGEFDREQLREMVL